MSKISIIIPVYYNEDTLMLLYHDMQQKILFEFDDYEIVMVDDGSKDSSWQVMKEIKLLDDSHIKLVRLSKNFGEHAAILAGLNECTGDCAVTKQADCNVTLTVQENTRHQFPVQPYHVLRRNYK